MKLWPTVWLTAALLLVLYVYARVNQFEVGTMRGGSVYVFDHWTTRMDLPDRTANERTFLAEPIPWHQR